MEEINYSPEVEKAFYAMAVLCRRLKHEFLMPEHLLMAFLGQKRFNEALEISLGNPDALRNELATWLAEVEKVPEGVQCDEPGTSVLLSRVLASAVQTQEGSDARWLTVPHLVKGMLELEECMAGNLLRRETGGDTGTFMSALITCYEAVETRTEDGGDGKADGAVREAAGGGLWRSFVTCLNDRVDENNPLIGREHEMERTIQVLCRRDKNNPLHVGEPGVGKTALIYGLVRRINDGQVPERLRGCRVYQLDMGAMLAGAQYRGDLEKRIRLVMDGVGREKGAIVYIDGIQSLVGAGAAGGNSVDASNVLKPYLEAGDIRFIGSTTNEAFSRHLSGNKGLVRCFQQIDIAEPGIEESIRIVNSLKKRYERFHGVAYAAGAIDFAVRASARYINDRFLPDKAIDLIDEAGAYRELHPLEQKRQTVNKVLIAEILSNVCKVDALAMRKEGCAALETLGMRISSRVYGQDAAVFQVTEAVQMAKAGLSDESKPLASLLFVGPTGVGKTEVARVLADELGLELVRFDMSEYTEKHSVAKLIGSPAGYVGYEDGGLLTDAVRRSPSCVLLLDEIEKAHPDIYDILLQVMDYARLTDNKGHRADFRNVVLILTSNAGAQYVARPSVGFVGGTSAGGTMMKQVKKTFKPEFINRLSATVVFNEMDAAMASLILDRKLRRLREQLAQRKVSMKLSNEARAHLLRCGFSREYGAREIDRVVAAQLKPLFVHEILFGRLKKGGTATVDCRGDMLVISNVNKS